MAKVLAPLPSCVKTQEKGERYLCMICGVYLLGRSFFKSHLCVTKRAFSFLTATIPKLLFKNSQSTATFSKATVQPNISLKLSSTLV